MKKEFLILSFLVGCSATGCLGHVASDAESDPVEFECEQAADLNADYNDALDQIEEIENDTDAHTVEELRAESDALFAEIEEMAAENENLRSGVALWKLKYEGTLEQFRLMQDSYGGVVSEYMEYKSLCELHGVWQEIEVDTEGGDL